MAYIEFKNVVKEYTMGDNKIRALDNANFEINKGVGREVEFKGLRAQYLFIFAAGLLAVFVMFVILYMAGVGQ